MAEYDWFFDREIIGMSDEGKEGLREQALKIAAHGYRFNNHGNFNECLRCGVLVAIKSKHDLHCPPDEEQLQAQLELLELKARCKP